MKVLEILLCFLVSLSCLEANSFSPKLGIYDKINTFFGGTFMKIPKGFVDKFINYDYNREDDGQ